MLIGGIAAALGVSRTEALALFHAMAFERGGRTYRSYLPRPNRYRPHQGQRERARRIRQAMRASEARV